MLFVPLDKTEGVRSGQVAVDGAEPPEADGPVVRGSAYVRIGRKVVKVDVRAYYSQDDAAAAEGPLGDELGLMVVRPRVVAGFGFGWVSRAFGVGLAAWPDEAVATRVAAAPDTVGSLIRAISGMTARGLVDPSLDPGSYSLHGREWRLSYPERARAPGAAGLHIGPYAPWVCTIRPATAQLYAIMVADVWGLLTLYAHLAVVAGCLGGPALQPGPGLETSDMVDRQVYLLGEDKALYADMWDEFNRKWAVHNAALVAAYCELDSGC